MIDRPRPGIVVVGTAHVSATSVAEVEQVIRAERPSRVLVELDAARLAALQDPEAWQRTDIFRVMRERKQHLFLLQLYLAAMQARMGRETGVSPGAELLRAVQVAEEVGAEVVLADRPIAVTLKRGFGAMGFWAKLRLSWHVVKAMLPEDKPGEPAKLDVDALLESDAITRMTEEFARFAPAVKVALIDERDDFMASHITEEAGKGTVVAVVGAGHLAGIRRRLDDGTPVDRAALLVAPRRRITVGKVVAVLVPLTFGAVLGILLLQGNYACLVHYGRAWILWHAVLAGLGAALAFGHPAAIATAAVAAPFTSIIPIRVNSGILAGFAQAWARRPTVADFHAVKTMETMRQFWGNGIVRVLTVATLTVIGSWAASWIVLAQVVGGTC